MAQTTVAQFSIFYNWKPFQVDMAWVDSWLRANAGPDFVAATADDRGVTLWFRKDPGEYIKALIQEGADGITSEEMIASINHRKLMDKAVEVAKANVPVLQWNDMIPAERRIAMNQPLSDSDKEALLAKYPQNIY